MPLAPHKHMTARARDIRILLVADSHLGFDHPIRPRVRRRRRGHDFLANYRRALQAAVDDGVDLVVHGGDVFHAPTAPRSLVYQAFAPLKAVADADIPVFLVPGNHERSRIPFDWLARHPGIHVFQEPTTVSVPLGGQRVAVCGVPCVRRNARARFPEELAAAGWSDHEADVRLLVAHQAFEGAVVGVQNFMFREADDVVRLADIPRAFAAVLSGHIHRAQILESGLDGIPAPAPVLYPGSVERTAYQERLEPKGYITLSVTPNRSGGSLREWRFHDLGARPMEIRPLPVIGRSAAAIESTLRAVLGDVPADAVLRLETDGLPPADAREVLSTNRVRARRGSRGPGVRCASGARRSHFSAARPVRPRALARVIRSPAVGPKPRESRAGAPRLPDSRQAAPEVPARAPPMETSMPERRYSEDEVSEIFAEATAARPAGPPATIDSGLTLAELQAVGEEVGVPAEDVARAAAALDARGQVQRGQTMLGAPLSVGRVVDLPREATDREWQFILADLRETFGAKGRVAVHGGVREWSNGNLHAVLEQTAEGHRLRLGTRKGSALEIAGAAGMGLFMALIMTVAMVAKAKTGAELLFPAMFAALGGGALVSTRLRLPKWAAEREAQMEGVAARTRELLSSAPPNDD